MIPKCNRIHLKCFEPVLVLNAVESVLCNNISYLTFLAEIGAENKKSLVMAPNSNDYKWNSPSEVYRLSSSSRCVHKVKFASIQPFQD